MRVYDGLLLHFKATILSVKYLYGTKTHCNHAEKRLWHLNCSYPFHGDVGIIGDATYTLSYYVSEF